MADSAEKDENRLECNENFIDAVFEIAFGDSARGKYTNEEVVLKLREFSDNSLHIGQVTEYLVAAEAGSMSRNNSEALAGELLEKLE